jgi:phytoene/squalene synthetase
MLTPAQNPRGLANKTFILDQSEFFIAVAGCASRGNLSRYSLYDNRFRSILVLLEIANKNREFPVKYGSTMTTIPTTNQLEQRRNLLELGNSACRRKAKRAFRKYLWMISNLPGEKKNGLYALLAFLVRLDDYLEIDSPIGLSVPVWSELRDELSDAFAGRGSPSETVALVHACDRYQVPRQFLFDVLEGVDTWIRHRGFESYDDLLVFAYRLGGAPMIAAAQIGGVVKPGFEELAIKAGQALFLTNLLANLVADVKLNQVFMARNDLATTGASLHRIKLRQPHPELRHLVRLYGARADQLLHQAGQLTEFLDYDATRSFKSLMALAWSMLIKMRINPEIVLDPAGVLTRRELLSLRFRHFLGLEGNNAPLEFSGGDHQVPH